MNQSSRWMYVVFALCAAAVLGALAFVTSHVLRLERRDVESRAAAKADESIRLALWRMDSAVNAIIAKEAARPYFEYQPFYAADRAYTKMFEDVRPGEVLVPSPLLLGTSDYITLHFQRLPDGSVVSPQVPTGNMRDLAESAYVDSSAVIAAEDRLRHLASLMSTPDAATGQSYAAVEPANKRPAPEFDSLRPSEGEEADRAAPASAGRGQAAEPEQAKREYAARSQTAERAASNVWQQRVTPSPRGAAKPNAPESTIASVPPLAPASIALPDASTGTPAARDQADASKEESLRATLNTRKDVKAEADEAKSLASASIEQTPPADAPARGAFRKQATASPAKSPPATPGGPAPGAPSTPAPPSAILMERGRADPAVRVLADPTAAVSPPGTSLITRTESLGTSIDGSVPPLFALAYEPEPAINLSPFVSTWVGESPRELIFTRTIHTARATLDQGLWIDWPRLAAFLQSNADDLVPGARVVPTSNVPSPDSAPLARRLASIPAELQWTPPAIAATTSWTPARTTLVLTWIATLIAIAAIAMVLHASTDLAERRGRFVSAVTHELRTPLTTFCMYSQMLADGMVTSDDARRDYLHTLKQEASRLSRIVENVLDYARLGRKKKSAPAAPIAATDLLARVEPTLRLRAEQSGVQLVIHSPGPSDAAVRADPATVERILYNLVDNACKYAFAPPPLPAGEVSCVSSSMTEGACEISNHASPHPIELCLTLSPRHATFSVRDQGPGIPEPERARIFKPFHRGPRHSDGSIPGLGLGLALARGLAHTLGGTLSLAPIPVGTQLDLTLPRDEIE